MFGWAIRSAISMLAALSLSREDLDKVEEYWLRTHQPDIHLLSAWIRGYDAMQFRASR
jgi:hypothetical protein